MKAPDTKFCSSAHTTFIVFNSGQYNYLQPNPSFISNIRPSHPFPSHPTPIPLTIFSFPPSIRSHLSH